MMHLTRNLSSLLAAIIVTAMASRAARMLKRPTKRSGSNFQDWLTSAPQFDGPREMYNKYRAGLVAKGASHRRGRPANGHRRAPDA